jgi:hypothetical protein
MWEPIRESEILQLISSAEEEMEIEPQLRLFWERIKVNPIKWHLSPWGDEGGGFWVVALIGRKCIYFNDIEEGFNVGCWSHLGCIDNYWCNQTDLIPCTRSIYQQVVGSALPTA